VKAASWSHVAQQNAYLLFYQRVPDDRNQPSYGRENLDADLHRPSYTLPQEVVEILKSRRANSHILKGNQQVTPENDKQTVTVKDNSNLCHAKSDARSERGKNAEHTMVREFKSPAHIFETFRQNKENILAIFRVAGVTKFKFEVEENCQEVQFSLFSKFTSDTEAKWQHFSFLAFGTINPLSSSCKIAGKNVLLVLAKTDMADWVGLWKGQQPYFGVEGSRARKSRKSINKANLTCGQSTSPLSPDTSQAFVDVYELD